MTTSPLRPPALLCSSLSPRAPMRPSRGYLSTLRAASRPQVTMKQIPCLTGWTRWAWWTSPLANFMQGLWPDRPVTQENRTLCVCGPIREDICINARIIRSRTSSVLRRFSPLRGRSLALRPHRPLQVRQAEPTPAQASSRFSAAQRPRRLEQTRALPQP